MWEGCLAYLGYLRDSTPIREVYLDGRFFTSSEDVRCVEVGIELTPASAASIASHELFELLRLLNVPSREEFGVRVRFFAPHRPSQYNFHAEFSSPDPEVSLKGAPADLRKGYIKITL